MSHKYVWYSLMINFTDGSLKKIHTEFPRLDALHVLNASARFNAGCSGRQTF